MIRKILSTTLFTVLAVSSAATASEIRAPFISKDGPLRYDLYKKKNKCSFDMFSTGHYRTANKTFLKHGTDTHPLTALIFGKSDFYLSEAFEDANDTKYFTENRSPFLDVTKIAPRVSYSEYGATLGGRFEYPVWHNKGRVGLRAAVPFKTVRMERDDEGEATAMRLQDAVIRGDATIIDDGTPSKRRFEDITRYKLALLNKMLRISDAGKIQHTLRLNNATPSGVNNVQYDRATADIQDYIGTGAAHAIPFVIIPARADKNPPFNAPTAVTADRADIAATKFSVAAANVVFGKNITAWTPANGQLVALNGNGANAIDNDRGYVFAADVDYTKLPAAENFRELWVTPVYRGNADNDKPIDGGGVIKIIDRDLASYRADVEEFMRVNGNFMLATNERTGLGDIDLDAFYEHTFNNNWRGEVFAGLRLPTGGSDNMQNNAFTQQLGNSNHFEIKLGGNIGWAAFDWMNLKAEASYSFVLEDTEHRLGVYKGSKIKNFGPSVDADVDWGYFIGKIDATFYHPKTEDLATTLGYQIYYKTEENINFKKATTTNHALGKAWADVNGKLIPSTDDATVGTQWVNYEMPLDNKLAEANTEAVAHRVFFESNWKAHKYMNLYVGGVYTFAGQNMPRESDVHAGALIKF